jgi:GNAT superfamily N-acetyltransferase
MTERLRVEPITGSALESHIPALARLRIEVFREFPYLYDGDLDYETRYLRTYAKAPGSLVVLVFDGEAVVGASTALPMAEADPAFRQPFRDQGWNPDEVYYLGESVLLRPYRGRGLGVRFFEEREAHAHRLGGFAWAAFCAVDRPAGHPRRPPGYRPLDAFWNKRGYTRHPELVTRFHWKDLDDDGETEKPMTFWLKALGEKP